MKLVEATEEEKLARDPLCHTAWGTRLTPEQFFERERRLRGHPWARERMITWLWKDDRGEVLASCETFRMDSVIAGTDWGSTYGVASVFTEPRLRGRGYCTGMMKALVQRLRESDPRAQGSILFSDVGAPLYERAGYVARAGMDRVWSPLPGDPREGVDASFTDADVPREQAAMPVPEASFVVWPSAGQLDWHLERERAYSALMQRPRPSHCGARVGDSRAFWMGDLKDGRLMVLMLQAGSAEDATALLQSARRVAHAAQLGEVRLYDVRVPFAWPNDERGGRLAERDGGLAMLAPLDARVRPEEWHGVMRALWM